MVLALCSWKYFSGEQGPTFQHLSVLASEGFIESEEMCHLVANEVNIRSTVPYFHLYTLFSIQSCRYVRLLCPALRNNSSNCSSTITAQTTGEFDSKNSKPFVKILEMLLNTNNMTLGAYCTVEPCFGDHPSRQMKGRPPKGDSNISRHFNYILQSYKYFNKD